MLEDASQALLTAGVGEGAAAATRGVVLRGPYRDYLFQRCCGGSLDDEDEVWGKGSPGDRARPDAWRGRVLCRDDPMFRWQRRLPAWQVERALDGLLGRPGMRLLDFREGAKTPGGRNRTLRFEVLDRGSDRVVEVEAARFLSAFGREFGWKSFPSAGFSVRSWGDFYLLKGFGMGHGVGLCQSGARRLAALGWKWRDILKFYYPRAELQRAFSPGP